MRTMRKAYLFVYHCVSYWIIVMGHESSDPNPKNSPHPWPKHRETTMGELAPTGKKYFYCCLGTKKWPKPEST